MSRASSRNSSQERSMSHNFGKTTPKLMDEKGNRALIDGLAKLIGLSKTLASQNAKTTPAAVKEEKFRTSSAKDLTDKFVNQSIEMSESKEIRAADRRAKQDRSDPKKNKPYDRPQGSSSSTAREYTNRPCFPTYEDRHSRFSTDRAYQRGREAQKDSKCYVCQKVGTGTGHLSYDCTQNPSNKNTLGAVINSGDFIAASSQAISTVVQRCKLVDFCSEAERYDQEQVGSSSDMRNRDVREQSGQRT